MQRLVALGRAVSSLLAPILLAAGAAWADVTYKIQPILKLGDTAGGVQIKSPGDFEIGGLDDNGQIAFVTESKAGGETLIRYSASTLTPIVVGGRDAPGGKWATTGLGIDAPVSMNQLGNIVFATGVAASGQTSVGTYLWDANAKKVTPVVVKGMPAVNNLTFEAGGGFTPAINHRGEIALVATVNNAAGKAQQGLFFLGTDGRLQPVSLPDEALPGGDQVASAWLPSINDAGVIAFLVLPQGQGAGMPGQGKGHFSGYVWEQGTVAPVAVIGIEAPGGGKITDVLRALANNKNRNVLVEARVSNGAAALYLSAERKLSPVAVPGQEMPGAGSSRPSSQRAIPLG